MQNKIEQRRRIVDGLGAWMTNFLDAAIDNDKVWAAVATAKLSTLIAVTTILGMERPNDPGNAKIFELLELADTAMRGQDQYWRIRRSAGHRGHAMCSRHC